MPTQDHPTQATEVRRCARCGAEALVCVQAWEHRVGGLRTASWTLDYSCQRCGAKVTLRPQREIRVERLFAFLLLPAIFPSLFFFASARRKARAWSENPVVVGASATPLSPEPPARTCSGCRGIARCTEFGRRQTRWISLGTRFRYTCTDCGQHFTVHDDRGIAFAFVAAAVLSAMGTLVVLVPPGSKVGAEASNRWFGVAALVLAAVAWTALAHRIRSRHAHPTA